MKVAELRASGMRSIDAACEKVAGGDKRLFESVKRAYYRHRLAARAELEMRRLNQAKGGIEIRWSESSGASVSISSVGQIAEAEARRDAGFRPSGSAVTGGPAYPIIGDRKARRTSEKTAISMQNLINVLAKQRAKGSPQEIPSWAYKQLSVEQIGAVKEGDITIANTCRALDIGWSTLYQLIADGAIRTIKNRPKNPYYRRRAAPLPRQLRRGVIAHVRDGRGAGAQ
jgi:hypothetical protein